MKELWKDIKGYEGLYKISSYGRVKSLGNDKNRKEKILSSKSNREGYVRVYLFKDGKGKMYRVHRLVAEAFIPHPNNYPIINHKDEDKSNNIVSNLEWCTQEYNINYGTRNKKASEKMKDKLKGPKHPMYGRRGSKNPASRRVQCITTGRKFNCIQEATLYYILTKSQVGHITLCCQGKRKSAGKHPVTGEKLVWRYIDE